MLLTPLHLLLSLRRGLGGLLSRNPAPDRGPEEEYLAQSVDIYDLERRMRILDSGGRFDPVEGYGIARR